VSYFLNNLDLLGVVDLKEIKQEVVTSDDVFFKTNLNHVLSAVREELDDHRESINENTTEIQTSHEFLAQLDDKLDKLAARIDELTLLVKGRSEKSSTSVKTLTKREKQVFQTIYQIGAMSQFITYRDIAKHLGTSESLIAQYVTNIVEKGVPVVKRYSSSRVYLNLEKSFREKQAKHCVVGVNTPLSHWVN
jgi:DNA-directed RNA polymerase specialized sigma subunit